MAEALAPTRAIKTADEAAADLDEFFDELVASLNPDDDEDSSALREAWEASGERARLIARLTEEHGVLVCERCGKPMWEDWAHELSGRNWQRHVRHVCYPCVVAYGYAPCLDCEAYEVSDNMTYVEHRGDVCDPCLGNYSWCDNHEVYYDAADGGHDEDEEDDERDTCVWGEPRCEATRKHFRFPAEGGTADVENDKRIAIHLPAGQISEQGLEEIAKLVRRNSPDYTAGIMYREEVRRLDPRWTTPEGNFTKRLSKAIYVKMNELPAEGPYAPLREFNKLTPATITQIGNLAKIHSSPEATYWVELTRELNKPADHFGNEESCWWTSYSESRCIFKSVGGLGLRTFGEHGASDDPLGRAWIIPLDSSFHPTHDTMTATCYAVFNTYGNVDGMVAARLVQQMTGKTGYRKVPFAVGRMYVNNEYRALLVGDQETLKARQLDSDGVRVNDWTHPKRPVSQ